MQLFIVGSIPLLLATFGILYTFYQYFHPWTSEGISVGFEPGWKKYEEMREDIYNLEDNKDQYLFQKEDVNVASCPSAQSSFQHLHSPGINLH